MSYLANMCTNVTLDPQIVQNFLAHRPVLPGVARVPLGQDAVHVHHRHLSSKQTELRRKPVSKGRLHALLSNWRAPDLDNRYLKLDIAGRKCDAVRLGVLWRRRHDRARVTARKRVTVLLVLDAVVLSEHKPRRRASCRASYTAAQIDQLSTARDAPAGHAPPRRGSPLASCSTLSIRRTWRSS